MGFWIRFSYIGPEPGPEAVFVPTCDEIAWESQIEEAIVAY